MYEFYITRNGEEYYCEYDGKEQKMDSIDNPDEVLTTFWLSPNISISVFVYPDDRTKSWASVFIGYNGADIDIPKHRCHFICDY
jgi:hypothetical protein